MRPCAALSFYVVRHGETDANAAGIIQGSSDISRLTAKGRIQASAIGSMALNPTTTKRIDEIFVSPLTRSRDTLELLRQSAPPNMLPPDDRDIILPNLREIDFYSWECQNKDELQRTYPDEYAAWEEGDPDGLVVDGRLPLHETWSRAEEVWKEIRLQSLSTSTAADGATSGNDNDSREETAKLLVCHGTLGQALLGSAFGLDATTFRCNEFPNCGMAEIVWNNGEDCAASWRWHYPVPTEFGCLREQLG